MCSEQTLRLVPVREDVRPDIPRTRASGQAHVIGLLRNVHGDGQGDRTDVAQARIERAGRYVIVAHQGSHRARGGEEEGFGYPTRLRAYGAESNAGKNVGIVPLSGAEGPARQREFTERTSTGEHRH